MSARRCSTCEINYPVGHTECKACRGKTLTAYATGEDPDWAHKAFEIYYTLRMEFHEQRAEQFWRMVKAYGRYPEWPADFVYTGQ